MPIYEYQCTDCGGFDAIRPVSLRQESCSCPVCGAPSARVMSAPHLATMDAAQRRARGINERSAHEPKSSGNYSRLKHPAGCGCCAPGRSRATVVMPNGNKTFIDKRPWMISH